MPNLISSQRPSAERVRWIFGPFELAPSRGRLLRAGTEVGLAPKTFEVLVHLVRHRGRVVPRSELLTEVWGGTKVSEAAVSSVIRDLRRALDEAATKPQFIATLRGRGLRFVHPVEELPDLGDAAGSAWDDAVVHFERALEALDLVETSRGQVAGTPAARAPRERGELMVALARARWSAGATDEARNAFLEAAEVAKRSGDAEVLAQAALGFVGRSDVTPGVNREAVTLLDKAVAALPKTDSALRAELLARMGTELYYAADALESDALTRDALAMAERVGDVAVTAYTATTRHFACQRPEIHPKTRIGLADRAIALTEASPASDVLAFALQERMMDLLELGDGDAFDLTFARFEETTTALGQPFFTWLLSLFRGTRLLLEGNVDEAERMAIATLEIGQRLGTPNAEGAFAGQLFFVRREQGRLGELAAAFDNVAQTHRALPIFRAGRAAIAADASQGEANRALEEVMGDDLDDFPRDQNWIATLGVLAPAALAAQSEHRIRQLLSLLEPYSGRMIVVGQGAALHGAVAHHMGLLHAALGETEQAALELEAASALHTRAHASLWLEHTWRARAGV